MATAPKPRLRQDDGEDATVHRRILDAAFAAFKKSGYARTSTLEIATRARVSKRELYTLVGNKQEMLMACIRERAGRLQVPADMPVPHDRETLAHVLASFGAQLVREVSDPSVIAVFRLAIAEAVHAPEVARVLDSIGRETSRAGLRQVMAAAQSSELIEGSPAGLAEQFGALLWGDLIVSLLLGVVERPKPDEVTDVPAMPQPPSCSFIRPRMPLRGRGDADGLNDQSRARTEDVPGSVISNTAP